MSNYRDRVPCFCRFTGWRSRLSRSNLVAVAVATLHLAKEINYFGPLPLHQFLRRKRRQIFDARATLSGQLRTPACQRVLAFKVKRVSRATLSGAILWLSGRISKPETPAFQSASSSERTQAFRAGLVCRHFETAGRQFKSAGISRTGILRRRHFHVSYVMCPVMSGVMCHAPHASCVICHMLCVMCRIMYYVAYVMRHVSCVMCRVPCMSCVVCHMSWFMCHVWLCYMSCSICHVPSVMC
jgi:hypothetical protein